MTFSARVILDSVGPNGARLTTFEVVMPRIVLAEFNTHRMFSRNSASSRAIPVEKMLQRVKEHPFVPTYWGKNQKGMQADQELTEDEQKEVTRVWLNARDHAVGYAEMLAKFGVHKQITNRLLEPFMWHVVVFTATELSNFIALRNSKMAAPEIQEPAHLVVEAYVNSKPMELQAGEWHLPFVTNVDLVKSNGDNIMSFEERPVGGYYEPGVWVQRRDSAADNSVKMTQPKWEEWAKISAARCARTSYLTHEGKRDIAEDAALYEKLVTSGHMSPLEHPARALTDGEWKSYTRTAVEDWIRNNVPIGNFHGWQQFRKIIAQEHDFSLLQAAE